MIQLTLAIHALLRLPVRGMRGRVVRVHVALVLGHLLRHTARWLRRILSWLVADRRQCHRSRRGIRRSRRPISGLRVLSTILGCSGLSSLTLTLLLSLPLVFLLLLPSLPLLSDLLELCTNALADNSSKVYRVPGPKQRRSAQPEPDDIANPAVLGVSRGQPPEIFTQNPSYPWKSKVATYLQEFAWGRAIAL